MSLLIKIFVAICVATTLTLLNLVSSHADGGC
jgi:hypothetical protein